MASSPCGFELPSIALPIPSLSLPELPDLTPPACELDLPGGAPELPSIALPIPSLSLPELPDLELPTIDCFLI